MLSNVIRRFYALSPAVKVVVILTALVVIVMLSPLVLMLATALFFISVVVLIAQLFRRQSISTWAMVAGASVVCILVSSGMSEAL